MGGWRIKSKNLSRRFNHLEQFRRYALAASACLVKEVLYVLNLIIGILIGSVIGVFGTALVTALSQADDRTDELIGR